MRYNDLCHILSFTCYGIKQKVIVQVDSFSESVRLFLVMRANYSHRHNKHKHLILTYNSMSISGVCFSTFHVIPTISTHCSLIFTFMLTFKLIVYPLHIQFILNKPSKRLKLLFKDFFRILV